MLSPSSRQSEIDEAVMQAKQKPDYVSISYLVKHTGMSRVYMCKLLSDKSHLVDSVGEGNHERYSRHDIELNLKVRIQD